MTNHSYFFVLERFRRHFSQVVVGLEPLSTAPERPRSQVARVYFREQTGVALLELEFSKLEPGELTWILRLAEASKIAVLDPAQLAGEDRDRFSAYLDGYETCVGDFPAAEPALLALGRELRLVAGGALATASPPEASSGDGILLARARLAAPRTRRRKMLGTGAPPQALRLEPAAESEAGSRGTPLNGVPALGASTIEVKYRRGDEWQPGRLRSLNAKSILVATGAPPRLLDQVHVALRFRGHSLVVRGIVDEVSDPGAESGTAGFRALFTQLEVDDKRQLVALLRAAREAGVSVTPPPPRAAVRFPVCWPVRVSTPDGHLTVSALDVSMSGLFIGTETKALGIDLQFLLPLDNGEAPIRGRARVARQVDAEMAKERGLRCGYGVHIVDLGPADFERYEAFLSRIRRRAGRRVVVAADAARAKGLVGALNSAGYAVSSGSDPAVLLELWAHEQRPPDVAVIDASLDPDGATWLRSRWEKDGVCCVSTGTDSPDDTRVAVDRVLRIGR